MFWLFKKKNFRSLLTNELYNKGQMGWKCVKWDWIGQMDQSGDLENSFCERVFVVVLSLI